MENREQRVDSIVQQAVDQSTVVIPPQLVERQAQTLLENLAGRLDKQGISIEQYLQFTGKDEEAFKAELLAEADRTLKRSLVLEAVADSERLEVTEDEVKQQIEQASQSASDPARTAREAFARPETRVRIESYLKTSRAVTRLAELAGGEPSDPASPATVSESTGETHVEPS